ncbi:coiled-coil domain-containing protein 24-like [Diadema antillarum]|uniref:coiled-coil domain-containing protein 24-like n=1 Tax=Diadema antillarum TaxID=105358 RepID=UPI003A876790
MEDAPQYNLAAYEKPLSLWKLVEEVVSTEERPDIRDILGISLVEQSLELHEEVDNLLSIWQDYREETEEETRASPLTSILPEPPGLRDNLRSHIRMLLECVREKAKDEGRETEVILARHNNEVLDYVSDDLSRNASPGMNLQRPGSSWSSRDGRETPMRMTPSSDSDRLSGTSTVSDQVDSVKDQLNILRIDEVANQLRTTLEEEISQLLKDSGFLQECLEEERDFRCQSRMSSVSREPSIQELKEERSRLEADLKTRSQPSAISIINSVQGKKSSLPNSPNKRLPSPLGPPTRVSPKLRPSPPPSAGLTGRMAPLKAPHGPGHPAGLPPTHPLPSRRSSDSLLLMEGKSHVNPGTGLSSRSSPVQPRSPVSGGRGPPESPTRLQPSPPSSGRPRASRVGSGRFRHRVVEAKESR